MQSSLYTIPAIPSLAFDLAAFDATAVKLAAHRHMFALPALQDGAVLHAIQTTLDAYASLGIAESTVATCAVLYHASPALAFNDAVWEELLGPAISQAPPRLRPDLDKYSKAVRNPFLHAARPDEPSFDDLVKRGTSFYVCNIAAQSFARFVADATKSAPQAIYDRLVAGLLPGASLVPAAAWAVHSLQQRQFTYFA